MAPVPNKMEVSPPPATWIEIDFYPTKWLSSSYVELEELTEAHDLNFAIPRVELHPQPWRWQSIQHPREDLTLLNDIIRMQASQPKSSRQCLDLLLRCLDLPKRCSPTGGENGDLLW